MSLNLFGKGKKDLEDNKIAQDVKEASAPPMPSSNPEENFVNPFNKEENPQVPQMPPLETPQENLDMNQGTNTDLPQMPSQNNQEDLFSDPSIMNTQNTISPNPNESMIQNNSQLNEEDIQEMIDETVEKIIDEKWNKVVSNVEKVISWKDDLEKQLNMVKEDIVHISQTFESLEKRLSNKISTYDKDIMDVGSEIKALEKVFQKITPTLVNNVNELSKIANDLKGEKKELKKEDLIPE